MVLAEARAKICTRRDERIAGTRIINHGALHRAAEYSVATLDLASDTLAFHVVA